jgi:hypothetical protein
MRRFWRIAKMTVYTLLCAAFLDSSESIFKLIINL